MSATTFNNNFQKLSKMAGYYNLPMGKKSVTAIKNAICLTTDSKSLDNAIKFVDALFHTQENLPKNDTNKKGLKSIHSALNALNEALSKINALLNTVSSIFDDSEKTGSEIEIDDENMIDFLAKMQTAKGLLVYITEYLSFYLEVQNAKNEKNKITVTFDELISQLTEEAA